MSVALSPAFSVALDARRWGRTGLGRYQSELYRHIRREAPEVRVCLVGAPAGQAEAIGAASLPFTAPLYSPAEQLLGGRAMRRANADVCHFPHYAVPLWAPRPYVVTVHDLIHFRFPQDFGAAKVALARRVLARAVRRAALVICVSESTRRDLLGLEPAARTVVIAEGVGEHFRPSPAAAVERLRARLGVGRYLLSSGDRAPHKRFPVAAAAFRLLRERDPSLRLVVFGERGAGSEPDPEGTVRLDYVEDDDLCALYTGAECLVFPSAYEGFGLPPLEAMACGCPVVCGRGSSLDEVCGGGAVQVDAADAREVADAADVLLRDAAARRERVALGLAHVARFSWAEAARQTLAVFADVAGRVRRPAV